LDFVVITSFKRYKWYDLKFLKHFGSLSATNILHNCLILEVLIKKSRKKPVDDTDNVSFKVFLIYGVSVLFLVRGYRIRVVPKDRKVKGMTNNLTSKQAASAIGISASTLAKMRLAGSGPKFLKLGKRVAYRPADIETWQAARVHNSTSEYVQ